MFQMSKAPSLPGQAAWHRASCLSLGARRGPGNRVPSTRQQRRRHITAPMHIAEHTLSQVGRPLRKMATRCDEILHLASCDGAMPKSGEGSERRSIDVPPNGTAMMRMGEPGTAMDDGRPRPAEVKSHSWGSTKPKARSSLGLR